MIEAGYVILCGLELRRAAQHALDALGYRFIFHNTALQSGGALDVFSGHELHNAVRRNNIFHARDPMVTSNLPFAEWTEVLGSERLTGAFLDRLTHHVHIIREMNHAKGIVACGFMVLIAGNSHRIWCRRKRRHK